MIKLPKLLCIGLLAFSCQSAIAADKAKTGVEATEEAMNKAKDKAATDAASAAAKLPAFTLPLTQDGEPEEPSKDFKWSPANIKLATDGDAKRGEELAKKGKCCKCHGDTGVSEDDDTPSIAGQITAYSFKQLHDYKEGLRESKEMTKKVRELSAKDMADISAWYATQKPEKMLGVKKGAKPPVLATEGDPKRHLLACNTCHNEDAMNRGYQIPILEGQKVEYFKETMMAFKEEDRANDHYRLMRGLTSRMTEEEINELAEYYSAKPEEEEEEEGDEDE